MSVVRNVPDDWDSYWYRCSECGQRAHESERHDCEHEQKKYVVVAYVRIVPEDPELMTNDEALACVRNLELMQPENKYEIELKEIV